MHEDAFGGHADLSAVEKGAEGDLEGGVFDVGVFADDGAGFAAEFHEAGFEFFAGFGGDDAADDGGSGEVDFLDAGMLDQLVGDCCSILWSVIQDVQYTIGQAGLLENGSNGPVRPRAQLGAFQDARVACGDGIEESTNAQDVWSIPWSNAQNDTHGLLEQKRSLTGSLGLRNVATDGGSEPTHGAEIVNGGGNVKLSKGIEGTRFLHHIADELGSS